MASGKNATSGSALSRGNLVFPFSFVCPFLLWVYVCDRENNKNKQKETKKKKN